MLCDYQRPSATRKRRKIQLTLLKIRDDKLKSYQAGLIVSEMRDARTVAETMKCSLATGARLWNGGPVGRKYLVEILRLTRTKKDDRLENNAHQLARVVGDYCEEVLESQKLMPRIPTARGVEHKTEASREADDLSLMTVYIKFVHLRDPRSEQPIYERLVARLKQRFPVYSETLYVFTLEFNGTKKNHVSTHAAQHCVVDLQPIFPAMTDISSGLVTGSRIADRVEHLVVDSTSKVQTAVTFVNAVEPNSFKPELPTNIYVGLPYNCFRLVIVVDTSSIIVNYPPLLSGDPTAYRCSDSGEETQLSCELTQSGGCIVDSDIAIVNGWNPQTDKLKKEQYVKISLPINWSAVKPLNKADLVFPS